MWVGGRAFVFSLFQLVNHIFLVRRKKSHAEPGRWKHCSVSCLEDAGDFGAALVQIACTTHTKSASDSPFHQMKKQAMPILSHHKFLQGGVASSLQRERNEMVPCCWMDGEWLKARVAGCSSTKLRYSTHPHHQAGERGPGVVSRTADVPAARGLLSLPATSRSRSQRCPHCQCSLRVEKGLSCGFWLLSMTMADCVSSPPTQGKPQAIQRFDPGTFVPVHPHAIHTLLRKKMIGNFIRHPFNSFNSSVNRQLPLLGNCLTHFLPEQPAGFTLQYFLFTFSTSPDIIPFLAEADC